METLFDPDEFTQSPLEPSKRIDELRREIEHHSRLYYAQDAPEISDESFDALMRELQDWEARY
ncbi:MAG: hypothetical protein LBP91_01805, partial [Coriobacteriales bacterium]|nr:hypothetical protein [Coriobacteriales bacterium]